MSAYPCVLSRAREPAQQNGFAPAVIKESLAWPNLFPRQIGILRTGIRKNIWRLQASGLLRLHPEKLDGFQRLLPVAAYPAPHIRQGQDP